MYYQFDHVRLAPDKQIGLHTQPGFEISYIITGKGTRILGTVTEPFEEGEVILVPPGLPHQWQFSPESVDAGGCIENITFHFSQTFLDRVLNAFPELSSDIMRRTDYVVADRIGVCLHRDKTLATGDPCCDYLYTRPGSEVEKQWQQEHPAGTFH